MFWRRVLRQKRHIHCQYFMQFWITAAWINQLQWLYWIFSNSKLIIRILKNYNWGVTHLGDRLSRSFTQLLISHTVVLCLGQNQTWYKWTMFGSLIHAYTRNSFPANHLDVLENWTGSSRSHQKLFQTPHFLQPESHPKENYLDLL